MSGSPVVSPVASSSSRHFHGHNLALPQGVTLDFLMEGSTKTLAPKRILAIAYKKGPLRGQIQYGASIYSQSTGIAGQRDLLDMHLLFQTALYRLQVLPVEITDLPKVVYKSRGEVEYLISQAILEVGCYNKHGGAKYTFPPLHEARWGKDAAGKPLVVTRHPYPYTRFAEEIPVHNVSDRDSEEEDVDGSGSEEEEDAECAGDCCTEDASESGDGRDDGDRADGDRADGETGDRDDSKGPAEDDDLEGNKENVPPSSGSSAMSAATMVSSPPPTAPTSHGRIIYTGTPKSAGDVDDDTEQDRSGLSSGSNTTLVDGASDGSVDLDSPPDAEPQGLDALGQLTCGCRDDADDNKGHTDVSRQRRPLPPVDLTGVEWKCISMPKGMKEPKQTPADFFTARFLGKHQIDLPKVLEARQYENSLVAKTMTGVPASMDELMKLSRLLIEESDSMDALNEMGDALDNSVSPD